MNATETANNLGKVNLLLNAQINREEGVARGSQLQVGEIRCVTVTVYPSHALSTATHGDRRTNLLPLLKFSLNSPSITSLRNF